MNLGNLRMGALVIGLVVLSHLLEGCAHANGNGPVGVEDGSAEEHEVGEGGAGGSSGLGGQTVNAASSSACQGMYTDPCGQCAEQACCAELSACLADGACVACLQDPECVSDPLFQGLWGCVEGACQSECSNDNGAGSCDAGVTVQDIVQGCESQLCAFEAHAWDVCAAGCGLSPSPQCVEDSCLPELGALSDCVAGCPGFVVCDPCVVACSELTWCGYGTGFDDCYSACSPSATSSLWACAAAVECDLIPACPALGE